MGTEIEKVVFQLDARQYIRAAQQQITTNKQLEASFVTLEKSTVTFGKSGEVTVTLRGINTQSQKVTGTLKKLGNTFELVKLRIDDTATSLKKQSTGFQAAIRNAERSTAVQALLARQIELTTLAANKQASVFARARAAQQAGFAGQQARAIAVGQAAEGRRVPTGGRSVSIERVKQLRLFAIEQQKVNLAFEAEVLARVKIRTEIAKQVASEQSLIAKRQEALVQQNFRGDVARRAAAVVRTALREVEAAEASLAKRRQEALVQQNFRGDVARRAAAKERQALNEIDRQEKRLAANRRRRIAERRVARAKAAAEEQTQAKKQIGILKKLSKSISGLGRIIGISLLIGAVFRLQQAFEDSAKAAAEFSIRLAEIDTIQTNTALTTERWANELRELSGTFGIDVLKQAEAAYQTLSNQVAQAEEAVRFLDAANRLAVVGVTSTDAAVGLLTATINAFRLPVEDAEIIASQFFKTVELGRVRIEDMADSFGRIALPASQLGVTLQELQAAIAVTTINGVKFNEASTFIRNILLKLIRPTDEMKKLFAELGVESGEAAIQTFGLAGFFAKLEERTKGSTTEIGNLFGRIRAISGALVFAGEGVERFEVALRKIEETTVDDLTDDLNKVLQTTGQQLKIASEQAKNFFQKELGAPALRSVIAIIKELGGMENILQTTVRTLVILAKTAALAFTFTQAIIGIKALRLALVGLSAAQVQATITAKALSVALALGPLAAAAAIVLVTETIKNNSRDQLKVAEQANLAILKDREKRIKQAQELIRRETKDIRKEFATRTRALFQEIATRRSALNEQTKVNIIAAKETTRQLSVTTRAFTKNLNSQITANKNLLTTARKDAKQAGEDIVKTFERISKIDITFDLKTAGLGQQIQLLNIELSRNQKKVQEATAAGDLEAFKAASKRVRELFDLRTEVQVKLQRQAAILDDNLEEEQKKRRRLFAREDLDASNRRIEQILRQQRLLREGTATQLKGEQRIQRLQSQLVTADTPEQIKQITDELNKARKEQELIEASARRERKIRLEGLKLASQQATQLAEIQRRNEIRAKLAQEEERRLKIQQFLFESISKEANAFNQTQVFKKKISEEIIKAVAEQQERLSQLIVLQRELGGGARTEELTRRRQAQLQEAAQLKLQSLQEEAQREAASNAVEAFQKQFEAATKLRVVNKEILDIFAVRLDVLSEAFEKSLEAVRVLPRLAPQLAAAIAPEEAPAEVIKNLQELQNNTSRLSELIKTLQERPSVADQKEFNTLFKKTTKALAEFPAKLSLSLEEFDPLIQGKALAIPIAKAIGETFQPRAGRRLPEFVEEQQARLRQLKVLKDELNTLQAKIDSQKDETDSIDKATEGGKTFKSALDAAADAVKRLREAAEPTALPTDPRIAPAVLPDISVLTEDINETVDEGIRKGVSRAKETFEQNIKTATSQGTKSGIEEGARRAKSEQIKIAKEVAEIQARELAKEDKKIAPNIAAERARQEAAARQRAEILRGRTRLPLTGVTREGGLFGRRRPFAETPAGQALRKAAEKQAERDDALLDFLKSDKSNLESQRASEELRKAIPGIEKGIIEGVAQARGEAARALQPGVPEGISGLAPSDVAATEALRIALEKNRLEQDRLEAIKASTIEDFKGLELAQEENKARIAALQAIDPTKRTEAQQQELLSLRKRAELVDEILSSLQEEFEIQEQINAAKRIIAEETEKNQEALRQVGSLDLPITPPILNIRLIEAREALQQALKDQEEIELRLKTEANARALASERQRAILIGGEVSPAALEAVQTGRIEVQEKVVEATKKLSEEELRLASIRQEARIAAEARGEDIIEGSAAVSITAESIQAAKDQQEAALRQEAAAGDLKAAAELQKSATQRFAESIIRFERAQRQPVTGFADGGPVGGVDNIPAMLTKGEFVVNPPATRRFFPQLMAMNSGRLRLPGFANGGPVNVGGIRVTVNESSSPQVTARQIVSEINRGLRAGTVRFRTS